MAYIDADLYKVAELGGGRTMWAYHTVDVSTAIDASAYFTGEAIKKIKSGDIVITYVYTTTLYTGAIADVGAQICLTNTGSVVNVNAIVTLLGATGD
jgi:hypothetical protein